jgi:SH3-like domain-containing protein
MAHVGKYLIAMLVAWPAGWPFRALAMETTLHTYSKDKLIYVKLGTMKGKIVQIPAGIQVDVGRCGEYDCEVTWKGVRYWVSTTYLKDMDVSIERTPMRSGPAKGGRTVATLPKDAHVLVHKCASKWCDVSWNRKRGWVDQDVLLDAGDDGMDDF